MVLIEVEVFYADSPKSLWHRQFQMPLRSTVREALEQSGLFKAYPNLSINNLPIGVFSKKVALDDELQGGERIEIYRSLTADPKLMRRQRVGR